MNSINLTSNGIEKSLFTDQWTWSFGSIFALTLCSLITILTILGNGLVLISVKYRFHARSYSDYFIVSLCLADFFVGLFVMPLMTIHTFHLRWPFHYRLCYIWMSIDFTCSTASFLTLASMALDRYYALTAPYFHLRNRSYSSVLICIISSWIIPFAIWPSSIFLADYFNVNQPTCVHPAHPFIIVILCTFFYYIPLGFMLICYSKIIVNIKNIEVMIKDTWECCKCTGINYDYQSNSMGKYISRQNSTSPSNISFCTLIFGYFQRNTDQSLDKISYDSSKSINHLNHHKNSVHHKFILNTLTRTSNSHRNHRTTTTTTATFTGQKRYDDNHRSKCDFLSKHDDEQQQQQQQFGRTRFSTRAGSLPVTHCVNHYYHQGRISDETNRTRFNSVNDRSRSQSHSSSHGLINPIMSLPTPDISDHSSSFENNLNDEHHRLNRRQRQSQSSSTYHSGRYSQRAIAQFMHERNKARLRRNQKASRMLGILLAVFLICWLPFTISYPAMIFYPKKFSPLLESIIFWFGYVNSLLNPFLYVYSSRNFRQAILETLCCYTRRQQQHLRYRGSMRN